MRVPALVRRARDGDTAAFELLYREGAGRVYALCLRMTADPTRAEELAQDAFVLAWEKLPSLRDEEAYPAWLHRLTVNVVLQAERSKRRRLARVVPVEDPAEFAASEAGRAPANAIDLERAVRHLPARARQVFVLHDIEGYTHEEVAELMGSAPGTSKAQLHRARRLLREMLDR